MWPFNLLKKPILQGKEVDTGKFAQALCDQCSGWLGLPIRKAPKILLAEPSKLDSAKYYPYYDTIIVYGGDNMTDAKMVHEMAHAVMRVVPGLTPEMQEILAKYCEHQINKVLKN